MPSVPRRHHPFALTAVLLLALAPPLVAAQTGQMEGENLLMSLPDGFVPAYHNQKGSVAISEMIPSGETLDHWSEIHTMLVLYGGGNLPIDAYVERVGQSFRKDCDMADTVPIASGTENGYKFAFWLQNCSYFDRKKPPETTWFKMINGNDSSYVVQHAVHAEPTTEQTVRWARYFATVKVCDSRIPDRACPHVQ